MPLRGVGEAAQAWVGSAIAGKSRQVKGVTLM